MLQTLASKKAISLYSNAKNIGSANFIFNSNLKATIISSKLQLRNFSTASSDSILNDLNDFLAKKPSSSSEDNYRTPRRDGPRDFKSKRFDSGPRKFDSAPRRFDSRGPRRDSYDSMSNDNSLWSDNVEKTENKFDYATYEKTEVKINGENPPAPIENWKDMNLDEVLMSNIEKANFTQPVAMQKHVVPVALQNRDLIMTAQTGSGKTAAFLFPLITQLAKLGNTPKRERNAAGSFITYPRALILGPTRELVQQIYVEARQFCIGTGVRPSVVYGGSGYMGQLQEMRNGQPVDILIGTPGRVEDFLERRNIGLKDIKHLVLDEADRMLDMGFEPQIRSIIGEWEMPSTRQTMMFSATFPKEIQHLAQRYLKNDSLFMTFGRVGAAAHLVDQNFLKTDSHEERDQKLVEVIHQHLKDNSGNVLVFFSRKSSVDEYFYKLKDTKIPVVTIHGDKTQQARNEALNSFARGHSRVLLATSVASRGLDLKNIEHVINFELPQDMDDYVHRIGRTGRAGKKGFSTTFVGSRDSKDAVKRLISILKESKKPIPDFLEDLAIDDYRNSGRRRSGNSRYGSRDNFRKNDFPRREGSFSRSSNYDKDIDDKFDKLFSRIKK